VGTIGTIVTVSLTIYAVVAIIFLVSENRRPQATLAWMLVFFFVAGPWLGDLCPVRERQQGLQRATPVVDAGPRGECTAAAEFITGSAAGAARVLALTMPEPTC
jgi:hypothetical protein